MGGIDGGANDEEPPMTPGACIAIYRKRKLVAFGYVESASNNRIYLHDVKHPCYGPRKHDVGPGSGLRVRRARRWMRRALCA